MGKKEPLYPTKMVKRPPSPLRKTKGGKAYRSGLWAEWLCRVFLRLKGYRILAIRYKTGLGEIDIIARHKDFIVFIEVKARPSQQEASEALSPKQKARLLRAARIFLARHGPWTSLTARFDVMLVTPWSWPSHLVNAFSVDE